MDIAFIVSLHPHHRRRQHRCAAVFFAQTSSGGLCRPLNSVTKLPGDPQYYLAEHGTISIALSRSHSVKVSPSTSFPKQRELIPIPAQIVLFGAVTLSTGSLWTRSISRTPSRRLFIASAPAYCTRIVHHHAKLRSTTTQQHILSHFTLAVHGRASVTA